MGKFYDKDALRPYLTDLGALQRAYREYYARAYGLLHAAEAIHPGRLPGLVGEDQRAAAVRRAAGTVIRELGSKCAPEPKEPRLRFLSSLTCKGPVFFESTVRAACPRVYTLDDDLGLATDYIAVVAEGAKKRGLNAVLCLDPLNPDRLEALLLPDEGLGFVAVTTARPCPADCCRHIRLDALAQREILRAKRSELRACLKLREKLLAESVSALARAKDLHDELEDIYNPHVDFDGVYALADQHIRTLLG